MKRQAKVGGEIGANGEYYKGGQFINTVEENLKGTSKAIKRTGKQEIEPYVWEVAPEGMMSLYKQLAGVFAVIRDGKLEYCASEQTINYYGIDKNEIIKKIEDYNNGKRWI